ncbi:MAG: hypothetical protein L3J25_08235 [Flavobacteriaceae bacterium]|nr:hypothetical protein [Flavobacteriaceae bacterium]
MKSFIYSIIFFVLISFSLESQEVILSFKNEEVSKRIKKDSYVLSNKINNELAIILVERKDVFTYLYDSDFNKISELKTENVKSKYNEIIGYSINDLTYNAVFSNLKKNKFSILSLNFKTKVSNIAEIKFDLEDEIYLDAITYKNRFFLLSAKQNNVLNIRELDENFKINLIKTVTLNNTKDDLDLLTSKIRFGPFYLAKSTTANLKKIDNTVPSAIELTSSESKMYQKNNMIYFSFDNNKNATLLYSLNLDDFTLDFKTYDYPKGNLGEFKKFNSFLLDNYLYQIASSKEEMKFSIKSLNGKLIKEFYIQKTHPISFKNSPIIQEGVTALPFVTKREMEATTKYLRKITSGNVGLTVLKNVNVYYVTLGGFQIITNSGPMMVGPAVNSSGTLVAYNPTYVNYSYYSTTKSTYFNSILNSDFKHIKGKFKDNVFDKIKSYKSSMQLYLTAEDVFFHNGELYFGSFNQKEQEYNLVEF